MILCLSCRRLACAPAPRCTDHHAAHQFLLFSTRSGFGCGVLWDVALTLVTKVALIVCAEACVVHRQTGCQGRVPAHEQRGA